MGGEYGITVSANFSATSSIFTLVACHHVLLTLLLRSVRLKRIHGNVCAIEGAAIANIDNPNWILDLRVSSCGFCCHLTGEDAAEIPQTFDCAAAELNALMMPGYHPGNGNKFKSTNSQA